MKQRMRVLPLRWLFALGQAPLAFFAVGIAAVTAVVVETVQQRALDVAGVLAPTVSDAATIRSLGDSFVTIWLLALAAFFVVLALGSALVGWTHRLLSKRIQAVVDYAVAMGTGAHVEPLAVLEDDVIGKLEGALSHVSVELERRSIALREEADRQTVVAQVQRAMSLADSEEDAVSVVGRVMNKVVPRTDAVLLLADSSRAHLRPTWSSTGGQSCGVDAPARCPAVQQGSSLTFPDSTAIDACIRLVHRDPCAAVCVPVTVMGRAAGVMHLSGSAGSQPGDEHVVTVEALANAFGARIGMLRALQTSQLQAETDGLTGLLNRRSLEARAATLLQSHTTASVAMADLDHFKRLNDTYGHAAGDRALRLFAQVLRTTVRPGDIVSRCGGEEFVILLPSCPLGDAVEVLERVREALARSSGRGDCPAFTASFGVASFPDFGTTLTELLAVADAALYDAKTEGRDRIVAAGRGDGTQLPGTPLSLARA